MRLPTWLARNVRQVCEGGGRCLETRRETVRSATSIPSLRSSRVSRVTLMCSAGGSPAGARASSPVAWMAGPRETEALEPIDKALRRRVSEFPGRNGSERRGSPETESPGGRAVANYAKAAGTRRRRADAAGPLRRGGSGGTVTRTRRATGEALLAPPRNRRKRVGPITRAPGKWADDGRVADGPGVAQRRGNARGAKGPCCSAMPPATWKAGAA